jgi:hypothetical protein
METISKLGRNLVVGDTIVTLWGRDTILSLRPYDGSLAYLWANDGGARIATFAINKIGMTIEPQVPFEVVQV